METVQIRLTKNMLDRIDNLVKHGEYSNSSETVRDGVRRLLEYISSSNEILNVSINNLQKFIRGNKK